VIDPAEMLVSETAQPATAGDAPAQMRGPARKALDSSAVAPKTNGSSAAGAKSEQQPPATLATAASATKTAGDTSNETSADNTTADDAAAQSQTDSASGKVDAAQPASSGPAVPVASSTSQPGGAALVTGTAQAAVTPTVTTPAATTAASASAASATAEPTPDIDSLAVAIAANAARGAKHFDIRLDPPELGRVDVHMSVSRDGKAEALLTADRPETLELLQRDSKTLERALKDAGLDLSNNSLNFSLKGQHRQGDGGGASMARMRSLSDAVVARAEAANACTPIWSHAPGSARLDIRV
jgi:chemotaxis protein MotD